MSTVGCKNGYWDIKQLKTKQWVRYIQTFRSTETGNKVLGVEDTIIMNENFVHPFGC
jgi:hypothetical protein